MVTSTGVAEKATPPQLVAVMAVISGVGLMVMVNVRGVPVQVSAPFTRLGVTVIVITFGVVPALMATNGPIGPVPLSPNPIVGSRFD